MNSQSNPYIANLAVTVAVALALCLAARPDTALQGATINWTNADGGNFSDVANWQGDDVPGEDDTALFGSQANGTYTVTFTEEETTVAQLRLVGGSSKDVTLNLGGNTVIALGTGSPTTAHEGAIDIRATETTGPMTMRLTNGLAVVPGFLAIGERGAVPDPIGATLVIGEDATMRSSGGTRIGDRSNQKGTIRVENGGTWEKALTTPTSSGYWVVLGRSSGTDGTIVVDGAGSLIDFNASQDPDAIEASLKVGSDGTGTVEVLNGGKFLNIRSVELGREESGEGTLRVSGSGSELTTTWADIGLGNGSGSIEVSDGGSAHAAQNVDLKGGTLTIDNGTVTADSAVLFGDGSVYNLTLHDPDVSHLSAGTNVRLDGTVTLNLALGAGFAPQLGDEYILFTYAGDLIGNSGQFDGLPDEAFINMGPYEFQIFYGSGSDDYAFLQVTVIPEPASVAYLVLGLGVFLGLMRRRGHSMA